MKTAHREDSSAMTLLMNVHKALGTAIEICAAKKKENLIELAKLETEEAVIMKHLYAAEQKECPASTIAATAVTTEETAAAAAATTREKKTVGALRKPNRRNGIVKKKQSETTAKRKTAQSTQYTKRSKSIEVQKS